MSAIDAMSSAYWLHLKDRLDTAYYLHPSPMLKAILWTIVSVFPVAFVLFLISAFKRAQQSSFWLVRLDSDGYLQENRNVLIPILSAAKTTCALMSIISLHHDFNTHIHNTTIILQVVAFVLMHSLNWMRTWAFIYSMPPTSLFNFNQNRTRSPFQTNGRTFPPWVFNSLVLLGLLYGILLAVASLVIMCTSVNRVNSLYLTLSEALDENIILAGNLTSESRQRLEFNAALLHNGMRDMQDKSDHLFSLMKLVILCFLVINLLSLILFWWALHTIIRCLNTQLEAYSRSLRNRSQAIQLGMVSECEATIGNFQDDSHASDAIEDLVSLELQNGGHRARSVTNSITGNWRMWLPTLQRDTVVDKFLWKSPLMGKVAQKGPNQKASIRRQYVLLRRFKINTLWQAIFLSLMAFNYQSMGITLHANPFDIPTRTSTAEGVVIVILWSNLIWAIGGTAMAALSAVVAYSAASSCERNNAVEVQLDDAKSFDY